MDEKELLRQIAQVAGAINRHQTATAAAASRDHEPPQSYSRRARGAPIPGSHHKSLVLNARKGEYVSSRQRGRMTLTHAPRFAQAAEQTIATSRATKRQKLHDRLLLQEAREAAQLRKLEQTTLEHEGITYRISKRAHLLIRQTPEEEGPPTPLQTEINGVLFLKSPKTSNLFRKTTVKLHAQRRHANKTLAKRCGHFTKRGFCSRKECGQLHVPGQVAICPFYLRGACTKEACLLSHAPSANNTPQCTRFAADGCTVEACRYMHVETSTSKEAPLCVPFNKIGWCDAGLACTKQHMLRKRTHKSAAPLQQDVEDADSSSSDSDILEEQDFDEDAFKQDFVHL